MTNKQPEALRLALAIDAAWLENVDPEVADIEMLQSALRTQHADLLRKDALLRQALDLTHEAQTYPESESWSPSMTKDLQMLCLDITKELQ